MQETTIYVHVRLSGGRLSTGTAPREAPPQKDMPEPEMTISPGGLIRQDIVKDSHQPEEWDASKTILFNIQLLNSVGFHKVTGMAPPESPVNPTTYALHGFPFYAMYNEPAVAETGVSDLLTVAETDAAQGRKNDTVARSAFVKSPVIMLDSTGKRVTFRPVAHLEASAREILKERADAERKRVAAEKARLENDEPQFKKARSTAVETEKAAARRTKALKSLESESEFQRIREVVETQPNLLLSSLHSLSVSNPSLGVLIDEYTMETLQMLVFGTVYDDDAALVTHPATSSTGSSTKAAEGAQGEEEVDI